MAGFSRRTIARAVAGKLLADPKKREYWIQALAGYLVAHNRTNEAEMVANDVARELYLQGGPLSVNVTSVTKLDAAVRIKLEAMLRQQTGAQALELTERTDPQIIGGIIAKTPDAVLDMSIRSRLTRLAAIK